MNALATDIVQRYVTFSQVNSFNEEVYCKLHTLLHYGQLVKRFGPLYQFGTFRYERKHQYGKSVARVIRCFINTSKTIHGNHQILRALTTENDEFSTTDFWNFEETSTQGQMTLAELPSDSHKKLKSGDQPFPLSKNILRKIKGSETWFLANEFCQLENEIIYAKGKVLTLDLTEGPNSLDLPKLIESPQTLYILVANLNHSNDFMFRFNGDCYLLNWI